MTIWKALGALLTLLAVYGGLRWAAWEAIKLEEKERGQWPSL